MSGEASFMRPVQITAFFGSKGLRGKHLLKGIMSSVDVTKDFGNSFKVYEHPFIRRVFSAIFNYPLHSIISTNYMYTPRNRSFFRFYNDY